MFFRKKIKLSEFLNEIKSGNDDVLKLLQLEEKSFDNASYEQILENPADIASGVTEVKTKFNVNVFQTFENILIKHHDNGDIKYIFYKTTRDYKEINDIAKTIYNILGEGYYKNEHNSFKEKDRLINSINSLEEKDFVNVWLLENITILLQYKPGFQNEFSFFVTKSLPMKIDYSSRTNGTILDLLQSDLSAIFSEQEDFKEEDYNEDEIINFTKYNYSLEKKAFGIFDTLEIQQYGGKKDFSFQKGTNLTFTSTEDISLNEMVDFAEKLIKLYGPDNSSSDELQIHELELLENRTYWTGRNWRFNEIHGLKEIDNSNENMTYEIWLNFDEYESGYTLTIIRFDNLLEYFIPD